MHSGLQQEEITAGDGPAGSHWSWRPIGFPLSMLVLVNVMSIADRTAIFVLMPRIKQDLHLSDTQIGLVVGAAFSISYSLAALPLSRLADRRARTRLIAACLAIWSMVTGLTSLVQSAWQMLILRSALGAAESANGPAGSSLLCDLAPARKRSGLFSIYICGSVAGAVLTSLFAGWGGEHLGWRGTLALLSLPGLAIAATIWARVAEPVRGHYDPAAKRRESAPLGAVLRELRRNRTYLFMALASVSNAFVATSRAEWWPMFLSRVHDLGMAELGYASIPRLVLSAAGILTGGVIGSRLSGRGLGLPLKIAAAASVIAMLADTASLLTPSLAAAIAFDATATFLLGLMIAPGSAVAQSTLNAGSRATGNAALALASAVVGWAAGSALIGMASDRLNPIFGEEALRYAMLVPLAALPLLTLGLYCAARNVSRDALDPA